MSKKDSEDQKKSMGVMFRGRAIFKPLNTGWTDDLDAAFSHAAELCRPFTKKYTDPEAPYDGYEEADDTEEKARTVRLAKKVFRP